jgi:Protein of unknown function (DUF2971)
MKKVSKQKIPRAMRRVPKNQAPKDPELGLSLGQEWMSRYTKSLGPVPPLFHYTGAHGVRGILNSDSIWASGAQHMNDWMEVVYGYNMMMSTLRELVGEGKLPERSQTIFKELLRVMQQPDSPFVDAYFAAFCEKGNLLSQWRAYAGTQGFAIEVDPLVLEGELTLGTKAPARNLRLTKIEYDPKRQKQNFLGQIEELTETIEKQHVPRGWRAERFLNTLVEFVRVVLSSWAATVKHPGFEEEQEWRVIFQPLITAEEKYSSTQEFVVRVEDYTLITHVEFIPSDVLPHGKRGPKLPIKSITCGPNVSIRSTMRALEILLRNNGYEKVEIKKSEIPARS